MDNYRVVFSHKRNVVHMREGCGVSSQTRLKSCAGWKISDPGVWSRQNASSCRKTIMESIEDIKVLVGLSCNVGRDWCFLMDADVKRRMGARPPVQRARGQPVRNRIQNTRKRAHKGKRSSGQISSTGSKRSRSYQAE